MKTNEISIVGELTKSLLKADKLNRQYPLSAIWLTPSLSEVERNECVRDQVDIIAETVEIPNKEDFYNTISQMVDEVAKKGPENASLVTAGFVFDRERLNILIIIAK